MKAFATLLNSSTENIKKARVQNVVRTTAALSKQKIEQKLAELRSIENDIENMLDLCPDNAMDLNSSLKNFDPTQFVENLYDYALELNELQEKIKIATNIHNALFPDDPINGLTKYDEEFISDIVNGKTENNEE